jgi:hypothetical protein
MVIDVSIWYTARRVLPDAKPPPTRRFVVRRFSVAPEEPR